MKGFTLLELLVAVTILGVVAVAATSLFFSSIRGGGKVEVGTELKQNGQAALNTMEQVLRNASGVAPCSKTAASSITFTKKDNSSHTFSCEDVDDEDADTGYVAYDGDRLTSERVVVTACSLSCDSDPANLRPPLVMVNFTLRQLGVESDTYKSAQSTFSTSVSLRNYQ